MIGVWVDLRTPIALLIGLTLGYLIGRIRWR